jgi:hypothetical protein
MKATRIVSRPECKLVIIEMTSKQASELGTTCYKLSISQNENITRQDADILFTLFAALEARWAHPAKEEEDDDC